MINTLHYGDNLPILRSLPSESVDLVYLDPPFNSARNYNVLFKDQTGATSDAQITAFDDTWAWGPSAEQTLLDIIQANPGVVDDLLDALKKVIGPTPMLAYLVMMAARLVELRRILKPTGSLYLHCDPTASHYLKMILDTIFGFENFINEIVWKRSDAKGDAGQGAKHFGRVNDTIFFYVKNSGQNTFHALYTEMEQDYIDTWYRHVDADGRRYKLDNMLGPGGAAKGNPQYEVMGVTRYWRYSKAKMDQLIAEGRVIQTKPGTVPMYKRYLDESQGVPVTTNWADIRPLSGHTAEKLGYPTQKPLALLERIISASSNPGDIVLDPFCGCGTAIAAAEKLGRQWIGIDITYLAITLIEGRMKKMYPGIKFDVEGKPADLASAKDLFHRNPYQFQWWALSLVSAKPVGGDDSGKGKKGADKGIDGIINYIDSAKQDLKRVIIQVKGGHVGPTTVRDLIGVLTNEKAEIGVLITLEPPTQPMITAASAAGHYKSEFWDKTYPRLQILTIEQLLAGAAVQMPPETGTFLAAQKVQKAQGQQSSFLKSTT